MKKILTAFSALVIGTAALSAQVLDKAQIKNTTWTGFGAPVDGNAMFYGFTDTLQCRFDKKSLRLKECSTGDFWQITTTTAT